MSQQLLTVHPHPRASVGLETKESVSAMGQVQRTQRRKATRPLGTGPASAAKGHIPAI